MGQVFYVNLLRGKWPIMSCYITGPMEDLKIWRGMGVGALRVKIGFYGTFSRNHDVTVHMCSEINV